METQTAKPYGGMPPSAELPAFKPRQSPVYTMLRTIASILFIALALAGTPADCLAAGYEKRNLDSRGFFDTVGFIEPNLEAAKPSLPRYQTGTADVIDATGWQWDDSRQLWAYTAHAAQNNGASGAHITIRYPQAGWMRKGGERISGLLDIYVTFTTIFTNARNDTDKVLWGPYLDSGALMVDGFWVENALLYKTEYKLVDSETGEVVPIDNGMSYTERSLNVGEGFMVDGATAGYVASDMPDYVLGTNGVGLNWHKDEVESVLRHTQVTELHLSSDHAWQGFVGTVPQTVKADAVATTIPEHQTNFDLFLNDGFGSVKTGGGNQYIQGVDSSQIVLATISANGRTETFPDASLWMGASVIAPTSDGIEVMGVNFPRNALGGRSLPIQFGDISIASSLFTHADSFERAYVDKFGKHSGLNSHYKEPFGELKSNRWYVPQFHVFTAVTPPAPTKKSNKEETSLGEQIDYTVTQPVNASSRDAWPGFRYQSLSFKDTLPYGLSYKEGSFKVIDTEGNELESGTLQVTGSTDERYTLTWTADDEWLASGLAMNGKDLTFAFSAEATIAPDDKRYVNVANTFVNDAELETNQVVTTIRETKGGIAIRKSSAVPAITDDNPCYSLEGAQFGVYTNKTCDDKSLAGMLTTNADGSSSQLDLEPGDYWVKEVAAPTGYLLDANAVAAKVSKGETNVVEFHDTPQVGVADALVRKVDAASGKAQPQGSGSLAGTEFEICHYAGYYDAATIPDSPQHSWILATDDRGIATLDERHRVSGSELLTGADGSPVIPLGTVTIRETKAPTGYLVPDDQAFSIFFIKAQDQGTGAITLDALTVREQSIRGGVVVKKIDRSTGSALAGAVFSITTTSKNPVTVKGKTYKAGEVCLTCTSGKDGLASSGKELPYGSYTITETKAPSGYTLNSAWKKSFSISEDGQVVNLTGEPVQDDPLSAAAQIVGLKNLDGGIRGRVLKEGEFTFVLYDAAGKMLQSKRNDTDGKITFDPITFGPVDAGKVFDYTIKEERGSDQDIVYDGHEEKVSISVTQDKDGSLRAAVELDADGIVFNNSAVGSIGLPLTGAAGIKGGFVALLTIACAAVIVLPKALRDVA
ncbi:MAG: isopeptide-forming domain-containing fimbrial protein [Atopobiaceae bacterium]|nr:isopeptide-forming domain-containing fimbrial protein [Atopobiaceae bacterium]